MQNITSCAQMHNCAENQEKHQAIVVSNTFIRLLHERNRHVNRKNSRCLNIIFYEDDLMLMLFIGKNLINIILCTNKLRYNTFSIHVTHQPIQQLTISAIFALTTQFSGQITLVQNISRVFLTFCPSFLLSLKSEYDLNVFNLG